MNESIFVNAGDLFTRRVLKEHSKGTQVTFRHSKGTLRAHERHLGTRALKVLVHTGTLTLEEDLDNKAFKAFGHSRYLI